MVIERFPDPRHANPEGIVAVGGDLQPASLLLAYRSGIFPWPIDGIGLAWFSPDPRAVLDFDALHLSQSLKKFLKKSTYRFTMNQNFAGVISQCAEQPRPEQEGTWITPALQQAYIDFHRRGYALSGEVWEGDELVAGVYGVLIDGIFSAESMFHLQPNTSKLALVRLVTYLQEQGLTWMDIQVMTPHMRQLGATEIDRDVFLGRLKKNRR